MNIIFALIGISMCVAVVFLLIFTWAVKTGQYEDTYTPSVRMLFDDELVEKDKNNKKTNNKK